MDSKTPIEKLKDAHARLLKISVKGEDSLTLAEALIALTQAINELESSEKQD